MFIPNPNSPWLVLQLLLPSCLRASARLRLLRWQPAPWRWLRRWVFYGLFSHCFQNRSNGFLIFVISFSLLQKTNHRRKKLTSHSTRFDNSTVYRPRHLNLVCCERVVMHCCATRYDALFCTSNCLRIELSRAKARHTLSAQSSSNRRKYTVALRWLLKFHVSGKLWNSSASNYVQHTPCTHSQSLASETRANTWRMLKALRHVYAHSILWTVTQLLSRPLHPRCKG